jgi:hypothetical protein
MTFFLQLEAFAAWKEDAEENAHCDVVAKVTVPRWDESVKAEMEELAKQEGVTNFKVYMAFKVHDSIIPGSHESKALKSLLKSWAQFSSFSTL